MRVCRVIATKKIIETQSGGSTPEDLQTLYDNASRVGYDPNDVEVLLMTDAEYQAALLLDPVYQADLADREAKDATKQQALADALTLWRDDLNAIEVKVDALSQPYRGIFKDIIQRIRKNTRVLSWMFANSDG